MDVKLIIISPEISPNEFRLPLPITLGRSREAKIKLVHGQISRLHCEIFESDGKVMVKDLGSLNGTFLDGKQINESELLPGAILVIGAVTLKAVYESARTKKAIPVKVTAVKPKITDTVKVTETIQSEFVDPLSMPGPEFTQTLASFPTLDEVDELEIDDDNLKIPDDDLEIIDDDAPNDADMLSIEEVEEDNSGPVFTGDEVDDLEIVDDVETIDPDDAKPKKSSSAEDVDDMFDEWLEPEDDDEDDGGKGKK